MCKLKLSDRDNNSKDTLINTRRLTVHRILLEGRYNRKEYYSKILLQGKWVRNCGFEPEDKLSIRVYKGRIVIEKENEPVFSKRV